MKWDSSLPTSGDPPATIQSVYFFLQITKPHYLLRVSKQEKMKWGKLRESIWIYRFKMKLAPKTQQVLN